MEEKKIRKAALQGCLQISIVSIDRGQGVWSRSSSATSQSHSHVWQDWRFDWTDKKIFSVDTYFKAGMLSSKTTNLHLVMGLYYVMEKEFKKAQC